MLDRPKTGSYHKLTFKAIDAAEIKKIDVDDDDDDSLDAAT